ncbi:MAG: hypothetical protein HKP12_05015 [Gammaproteobacteria bacterium]|nr:hypothetical protein [Gammaproteobacteria bacterium]
MYNNDPNRKRVTITPTKTTENNACPVVAARVHAADTNTAGVSRGDRAFEHSNWFNSAT